MRLFQLNRGEGYSGSLLFSRLIVVSEREGERGKRGGGWDRGEIF